MLIANYVLIVIIYFDLFDKTFFDCAYTSFVSDIVDKHDSVEALQHIVLALQYLQSRLASIKIFMSCQEAIHIFI